MFKSLSFTKGQAMLLITLLVLIAMGIGYFFVYIPGNEKMVQERRFRCLRKIDQSIKSKIEVSERLITNVATDYEKTERSQADKAVKIQEIQAYAKRYSRDNFMILLPEQTRGYVGDKNKHTLVNLGSDTSGNTFYADINSQLTILISHPVHLPRDTEFVIGVKYNYTQFFQPLLLADVFDHYVVFINNHKEYEDYPAGLDIENPDSLLTVKNKLSSPGLKSLTLGETNFKIFSQPILTYTGHKWIVSGLLKDSTYEHEKDQLPLGVVLLLVTVAIALLVSLPWIKLFQMGSKDRLTGLDALGALIMAVVLISLVFFSLFKYRVDVSTDTEKFSEHGDKFHIHFPRDGFSRNVLATEVSDAFISEMNQANRLLDVFNDYRTDHKVPRPQDTVSKRPKNCVVPKPSATANTKPAKPDSDLTSLGDDCRNDPFDALFRQYGHGLAVREIYWLDKHGTDMLRLTTGPVNDPKGNYGDRGYFKHAGLYKLGDDDFYLDQFYSYTTGEYRSAVSHKNKDASVIAVSLTLKSLDNILLPSGYDFAVLSNKGWVLYHSKPNRRLVDQLQTEVSDDGSLSSALEGRADTSFTSDYYGKPYTVKVKPVADLPYFVVIFESSAYNDTRDTEAYIFTFGMLALLLIFLVINYTVIFFVSSRHLLFKGQRFDTSWIGPHKSAHRQYNIAIFVNCLMIIALVALFNFTTFLEYFYILLVSVLLASLNLNLLFAKKYSEPPKSYKLRYKQHAITWLWIILVIVNLSTPFNLCWYSILALISYQLLVLASPRLVFRWGDDLLTKLRKFKKDRGINWTYTQSYALMATTRLVISSGIPVAFFFIFSFNYEQGLDTQYRQLNFAHALAGSNPSAKRLGQIKNNLLYSSGMYFDRMYIHDAKLVDQPPKETRRTEDDRIAQLFNSFRLKTNDLVQSTADLYASSDGGRAVFSNLNRVNSDDSPVVTYYKISPTRYLAVASMSDLNYQTPHPLFWVLFALLIALFYFVFHIVIKKVFAVDPHSDTGWRSLDTTDNAFNKMAFVVGSPGAGTLEKLLHYIKTGKLTGPGGEQLIYDKHDPKQSNVLIADMMLIPTEKADEGKDWQAQRKKALGNCGLVIINHFEYNIYEPDANILKLDLLEALIAAGHCKVVVISTIHPLVFLESLYGSGKSMVPQVDRGRWNMLLGNFRVVIDPLLKWAMWNDAPMPQRAVIEETRYSRFLHQMQYPAMQVLKNQLGNLQPSERDEARVIDSLIFKIQLTAQYFYMDIWQSLIWEEKFLLYDLAEDGLVNPTDDANLSMLICKGLIINDDGALVVFNRSFRNFILTSVGQREIDYIRKQLKDNSKWSDLKGPFSVLIVAILAFLLVAHQEEYQQIIAYVTALGAGVPAVFKIVSMVGSGAKKAADK